MTKDILPSFNGMPLFTALRMAALLRIEVRVVFHRVISERIVTSLFVTIAGKALSIGCFLERR